MRRLLTAALLAPLLAACAPLPPAYPTPAPAPPAPAAPAADQPVVQASRVRIISLNDFHGALEPRADAESVLRGGAGFIATAIRQAEAECGADCATLVLDGGDSFQGTLPSNLTYGRSVLEVYREFGVAAAALGNHEFDWGQDTLRALIAAAPYSILGANVRDESGARPTWLRGDTLVERSGLTIGIVGIITQETPSVTFAGNLTGLTFVDPAPIIDEHARRLRANGADLVVVVAHSGAYCEGGALVRCEGEIVRIARDIQEPVAAIVSGHTHSAVNTRVNGIPIVQARSSGHSIAVLDLDAPDWRSRAEIRPVLPATLPADTVVARLVGAISERVRPVVERRIAESARRLTRTGAQYPLGNLIADAQRWAAGADIAVMNNGGIRADLPEGEILYGHVFDVQPFGNRLVRVTVTGTELLDLLENLVAGDRIRAHVSGVRVTYDQLLASGGRIVDARLVDGRPITPSGTYTIAMSDFLLYGGDNLGFDAARLNTEWLGVADLDALVAYLQALAQPFSAPGELRLLPAGL